MNFIPPAAEVGFVILGIVDGTGKAAELPNDNALLGGVVAEVPDHGEETLAGGGGGAGSCGVDVEAGKDESVIGAPGAYSGLLLFDGEFLILVAGIAEIGDAGGAGRERRGHGFLIIKSET
jgi:hypothetical protein